MTLAAKSYYFAFFMDEEHANGCDSVKWRLKAAQYLRCLNLFFGEGPSTCSFGACFLLAAPYLFTRLQGQHFPGPCLIELYICEYVSTSSVQNKLTLWSHRNLTVSSKFIMCYFMDSATMCVLGKTLKNSFGPFLWPFWSLMLDTMSSTWNS